MSCVLGQTEEARWMTQQRKCGSSTRCIDDGAQLRRSSILLAISEKTVNEETPTGFIALTDSDGPLLGGSFDDSNSPIIDVTVGPSDHVMEQDFVDEEP